MKQSEKLYLTDAAIMYPDGDIGIASRHYQVIRLKAQLGKKTDFSRGCIDGFVDNKGNFYNREEAKQVAINAEQIPKDFEGTLYSEDLWEQTNIGVEFIS